MKTAFEFISALFGFLLNWILFTLFGICAAIPTGVILLGLSFVVLPFVVLFEGIEETIGKLRNIRN